MTHAEQSQILVGLRVPTALHDKLYRMTVRKGFINKSECARFCLRIGLEYLEMEWIEHL